jgi:hypothetical protein
LKKLYLFFAIYILGDESPYVFGRWCRGACINAISYVFFVYFSIFQKKITFDEILKFVEDEQFKYLVLESINDKYYSFNLKMEVERKTAKEIVWCNWTVLANAD